MTDQRARGRSDSSQVPWASVARFIRQLSHDLRNDLNAIELQCAYLAELEANQELKAEIRRLREMIARPTAMLQRLARNVSDVKPTLIPYRASDLVEDLRSLIHRDFAREAAHVQWEVLPGDGMLNLDPQLLLEAIAELFANAFRHRRDQGALVARTTAEKGRFIFALLEPKSGFDQPTENWGEQPLKEIHRQHYGLGLFRVRAIAQAHGGELRTQFEARRSVLITTLVLPLRET
jgi:K+-sensing histidine kinase KdpD